MVQLGSMSNREDAACCILLGRNKLSSLSDRGKRPQDCESCASISKRKDLGVRVGDYSTRASQ